MWTDEERERCERIANELDVLTAQALERGDQWLAATTNHTAGVLHYTADHGVSNVGDLPGVMPLGGVVARG